jgi:hypothetical protein
MANSKGFYFTLWLCISVFLSFSSKAVDCSTDTVGLCTPTIEEIIDEVITETIEYEADGHTVTTTTDTTTTTTTVTNEDSGNILDGDNGYVSSTKEGDMDSDWGGQGPANMPSGNNCYGLGTDKCAQITGSGNSTSSMGVDGMGTTFINTVDISSLDIENGGRTNYTIKVDKQDAQDRIYMHITGRNGKTNVFSGTDILSESGVASGYQEYENGFDFAGTITTLIIEIGGRDINMAIGPLFDDITINVLYNVISTIVQQQITTVEMWVAYGGSTETEVIDIVENIIDHNDFNEQPSGEIEIEPIQEPDNQVSYEMVEMEMEMEMPVMEIEIPEMELEMPEIEMASVETEIEMEMEMEMPEPEVVEPEVETQPEPEPEPEVNEPEPEPEPEVSEPEPEEVQDEPTEEDTAEPEADAEEESEPQESVSETKKNEDSEEDMEETEDKDQDEVKKEESKKEVAAKKILKKMGDKGRYDSANQLKTLIVMQVLGNSKSFFEGQQSLNDIQGFFTDNAIPDAELTTNNIAQYFLFGGSDVLMDEMIMQQWQK